MGDCRYVVPLELNLDRDSELCQQYGYQLKTTYYGDKESSLETLDEYLLVYKSFHINASLDKSIGWHTDIATINCTCQ